MPSSIPSCGLVFGYSSRLLQSNRPTWRVTPRCLWIQILIGPEVALRIPRLGFWKVGLREGNSVFRPEGGAGGERL